MGDMMKYFIIGNVNSGTNLLANELSEYYGIEIFSIKPTNNIDEINKIVRENKEWIVEGCIIDNIDVLCNLAETIIFFYFSRVGLFKKKAISNFDSAEVLDLLKKHIRKGIIIRNKKQLKKYLKMVYESDRYNF